MQEKVKISLATKFATIFSVLILLVLLVVMLVVRRTVVKRFTEQYERSVTTSLSALESNLEDTQLRIRLQLKQLAGQMADDYDFRLHALILEKRHDKTVLDFAPSYMKTMGLDALEIIDSGGTVLSSGHDRNAFGSDRKNLITNLAARADSLSLVRVPQAGQFFLCLAGYQKTVIGGELFHLFGGVRIDSTFLRALTTSKTGRIALSTPGGIVISDSVGIDSTLFAEFPPLGRRAIRSFSGYTIGCLVVPGIASRQAFQGLILLIQPRSDLEYLLAVLNRTMLLVALSGVLAAILLAGWVTRTLAGPLRSLAASAGTVSLDTLDGNFQVAGHDEVGILGRALDHMQQRLRSSKVELAVAEKKAAFAQIARQVNHDIKNGFVPIRNVMRHWVKLAHEEPEKLPEVFNERKRSVLASIDYLESLARDYARLKPPERLQAIELRHLLERLVRSHRGVYEGIEIRAKFPADELPVRVDPLQLMRAFENIVSNAVEAISGDGQLIIETGLENDDVVVSVSDSGCGMSKQELAQIFQPYFTTKPDGTGLGLVNVKQIVEDFGGAVAISSQDGEGTTVTIRLPKRGE